MVKISVLCILTVFNCCVCGCKCKYAYLIWENKNPSVVFRERTEQPPRYFTVKAVYTNEINTTGWAFLELRTVKVADEHQAYSAGYLEGFLTRDLIWMHWQNMLKGYCSDKADVCGMLENYLDVNEAYIKRMVYEHPNDPYWYQVKLYYIQLEGLTMGYNSASGDFQWLTFRDIIWLNMLGDLDELAFALAMPRETPEGLLFPEHCTGLVKLLPSLRELYTAHTTWNRGVKTAFKNTDFDVGRLVPSGRSFARSYQSMLRVQKMYSMPLRAAPGRAELVPGWQMSFTSYPGMVQSIDDFYIISSGLVAAETTIGNSNRSLYEVIKPEGQILSFVRSMVANRLAKDGHSWVKTFKLHNSGTYNNQWYIVDYNKFSRATGAQRGSVRAGLLWVLEQAPGYTEAADLTALLVSQSYFPSYNIPYFPNVFNISGGNMRVRAFGDWFGYETNPRASIIRQKQAEVHNLRDMFVVMRYNNFKRDPLSRCTACRPPYSACNAIAARNDLNPANGSYPFRALGHRSHGATDCKVTSAHLAPARRFVAVAGPTHNISRGIPPFSWRSFDMSPHISHVGHPDEWTFRPLVHRWQWL